MEKNSKREIALIYGKLGQINNFQNKYKTSKMFFEQSLELNRKIQNKFAETQTLTISPNLTKTKTTTEALEKIEVSVSLTETSIFRCAKFQTQKHIFFKCF